MYIRKRDIKNLISVLNGKRDEYAIAVIVSELKGVLEEDDARLKAQIEARREKMHAIRMTIYEKLASFPNGATVTELQYALMDELDKPSMCKISGNLREMMYYPDRYPGLRRELYGKKAVFHIG